MSTKHGQDGRLKRYRDRRDFRKTSEPDGSDDAPRLKKSGNPIFVIQQHDASSMHWDFRIEVDGVLRSWAVPKGPSTDPSEKRLAVATEDHPLDYADFEGVIPGGEYGAGTVIVWDAGPYRNISHGDDGEERPIERALEKGHADVWLEGKKLRGGYALVHAKVGGEEDNWLLIKRDDEGADARRNPVSTEPESVISGRTLTQVAKEEGEA
ncbi:MAG: DNA polymerase ligase N-terminal domain-containing protein [Myxococcales bacterium]|jgi:DNA ligase D-like protein (predicted 3'-phosphoesterase)